MMTPEQRHTLLDVMFIVVIYAGLFLAIGLSFPH
jgi:hypothetical protein